MVFINEGTKNMLGLLKEEAVESFHWNLQEKYGDYRWSLLFWCRKVFPEFVMYLFLE